MDSCQCPRLLHELTVVLGVQQLRPVFLLDVDGRLAFLLELFFFFSTCTCMLNAGEKLLLAHFHKGSSRSLESKNLAIGYGRPTPARPFVI